MESLIAWLIAKEQARIRRVVVPVGQIYRELKKRKGRKEGEAAVLLKQVELKFGTVAG